MKLPVYTPGEIIAGFILLGTLTKNGLCMESYQYMSSNNKKNSICSAYQLFNSPWKIHFELINTIQILSIKIQILFFNMQKKRALFSYYLKRWSGRSKSQIYKDINNCSKLLFKICSTCRIAISFSLLPFCSLIFNLAS